MCESTWRWLLAVDFMKDWAALELRWMAPSSGGDLSVRGTLV